MLNAARKITSLTQAKKVIHVLSTELMFLKEAHSRLEESLGRCLVAKKLAENLLKQKGPKS